MKTITRIFETPGDAAFLLAGVAMQFAAYILGGSDVVSLVSGVFGAIAVVLCSQKRMSSYLFSFLQLGTYVVLAYRERLYGELAENLFYAVTMVVGLFAWLKNYNKEEMEVRTRELGKTGWIATFITFLVGTILLYTVLLKTSDNYPFLDSLTTVPAFVAQVLLVLRYREQWVYWLVVDVTTLVLWWKIGNWCMVAQYVFWTANCVYGYFKWKTTKK